MPEMQPGSSLPASARSEQPTQGVWTPLAAKGRRSAAVARAQDHIFMPMADRITILSYIHGDDAHTRGPAAMAQQRPAAAAATPRAPLFVAHIAPAPSPRRPRSPPLRRPLSGRQAAAGSSASGARPGHFSVPVPGGVRQISVRPEGRPVHNEDLARASTVLRRIGAQAPPPAESERDGTRTYQASAAPGAPTWDRRQCCTLRPVTPIRWRAHPTRNEWVRDPDPDVMLAPYIRDNMYDRV